MVFRKQACFPTYNIKNELFWHLGAEYVDRNHYLTWKQLRYWPDRKIASSFPSKQAQLQKVVGPGFKGEYIRYVEGKKKKTRRAESIGHFSKPVMKENEALMFYIHGGGFCLGARWCYRRMLWTISKHMQGRRVFFLEYDLAPENPYPGALHQCLKAYLWLLHTEKVWTLLQTLWKDLQGRLTYWYQVSASKLILSGDSAGGNLALGLLSIIKVLQEGQAKSLPFELTEEELSYGPPPFPVCCVLHSPWTDLTEQSALHQKEQWIKSKKKFRYTSQSRHPPKRKEERVCCR